MPNGTDLQYVRTYSTTPWTSMYYPFRTRTRYSDADFARIMYLEREKDHLRVMYDFAVIHSPNFRHKINSAEDGIRKIVCSVGNPAALLDR